MKFWILLLFLVCSLNSFSQVNIGISAGLNMGNWPGEDDVILNNSSRLNLDELLENGTADVQTVENKSRFATRFGLKAQYDFNEQWSIESGVYYSPQGDRLEGNAIVTVTNPITNEDVDNDVEYIARTETDYINIPLKAKIKTVTGWNFSFGPQIGYRLNGDAYTEGYFPADDFTLDFEEEIETRYELKTVDIGAIGSVEYQLEIGAGVSINHFLAATQLPVEDRKVYNSVTSLRLFYLFN